MEETDFRNAKVGDKVWSAEFGEVPITYKGGSVDIDSNFIHVGVSGAVNYVQYNFDGHRYDRDLGQYNPQRTLFWSEVPITPPPRPKRKVVRKVEGWINYYGDNDYGNTFCKTKEAADELSSPKRIACVHLTGTYEVEE